MPTNPTPEQLSDIVTAAEAEGLITLVSSMPDGTVRVFADSGSKTYSKRVAVVLPDKYVKKGTSYVAVYKSKALTKEKADQIKKKIGAGDKKLACRYFESAGKPRLKAGPVRVMTLRQVDEIRMQLRREAGYVPLHHRPGTRPALRKAVQKSWDNGVGKHGVTKKEAAVRKEHLAKKA